MYSFFGSAFRLFLVVCLACLAFGQSDQGTIIETNSTSDQGQSLADLARKARKDHTKEVQMSEADAKELFASVDTIMNFASEDTGFPKKADVKRRLVGSDEVEKYTREQEKKQEYAQRFARSELTMKKFGLLPRSFDLREFLVKANGKQIAAYYDFESKTVSMLNWIPLDKQKPILAHELTHALQDQNYDLGSWLKTPVETSGKTNRPDITDESPTARRAVTEGQAQVVYIDYLLAPFGRTLANTPGLIYQMEDPVVKAVADSELLHAAPMIMREMGTFPYKSGVIFEGELLQKGGKQMAFAGAFAHPPRNTHEVLQPKAYIDREKLAVVHIPDLKEILGSQYSVYDFGTFGELDVRALLKQFGERRIADDFALGWDGGRYVAFRKADANAASRTATTADLALLYVSHWKTSTAAEHFSKIYASFVAQRYQNALPQTAPQCGGSQCPVSTVKISTEEGPVMIEQWADNTVFVSEGFDDSTAAKILNAVRDGVADVRADESEPDELGLRLYDAPGFAEFQERIGSEIREQLSRVILSH